MAIQKITIQAYLQEPHNYLLLDVRSPGEYAHAHIPNAISLPLFNNEERSVVGTAYKQESRENAIKIGLKYFGPKMAEMVEAVEKILAKHNRKPNSPSATSTKIVVHCWRGGMRSAGVAWLLDLYGFDVYTIIGGYKSYRHWVMQQFDKDYHFKVVGGFTGSGKTEILQILKQANEVVIDLEALAQHKGSTFGNLEAIQQPSQEMFENMLAMALYAANDRIIWLEDESQRIGNVTLPNILYLKKQSSMVYYIDIPFEERLQHLVASYGRFKKDQIVAAIMRIKKRLGGLETKTAINFLLEDDIQHCFAILLRYYDKYYLKGLEQNNRQIKKITCNTVNAVCNTNNLLAIVKEEKAL
ncbi:tRNA 2-selenouridine(34) synthase MnmH [Parasediminibacterium paludis]|uniref:tRNA 2-selenouridine(34) synthase MnmH n=1 Tax=Parasediminibacterium paludis TaxID=908966 RepID=A0ABV8PV72_9BACT